MNIYLKIFFALLFVLLSYQIISWAVGYFIILYRINTFKIHNSNFWRLVISLGNCIIFLVLRRIVHHFKLVIFDSKIENMIGIIASILAVYAISFSLYQFYLSNSKENNLYLGYKIDNRISKLIFLDNCQNSTFFKLNLMYFMFAPLFLKNSKVIFQEIWTVSLLYVLTITCFSILWGYEYLQGFSSLKSKLNIESNKRVIELNIKYNFENCIMHDMFWSFYDSSDDLLSAVQYEISQIKKEEYSQILILASESFWKPISCLIKGKGIYKYRIKFYKYLLKKEGYNTLWDCLQNFLSYLNQVDYWDIDSIAVLFNNLTEDLCTLAKNKNLFEEIINKNEINAMEYANSSFNNRESSVLFPKIVFENKTKDIAYWTKVDQYLGRYANRIIPFLIGELEYHKILDNPLLKLTENANNKTKIVEYRIQQIIRYQLVNVRIITDQEFEYKLFVTMLFEILPEYTYKYIEDLIKQANIDIPTKELMIIKEKIKEYKSFVA
ncbi:hypothetical protein HYQ55_1669 [Lactobacillus crispatus]|nr:hypothetical protein [Lactobacillus crispatus]